MSGNQKMTWDGKHQLLNCFLGGWHQAHPSNALFELNSHFHLLSILLCLACTAFLFSRPSSLPGTQLSFARPCAFHLHMYISDKCPSIIGAADQKILLALLEEIKDQEVKIDFAKIALSLGPHCTTRAVQERIKKLKKMAATQEAEGPAAAPPTPTKVTKKKPAKTTAATTKAAAKGANKKATVEKGKDTGGNPKGKKRQRVEEPKNKEQPEVEEEQAESSYELFEDLMFEDETEVEDGELESGEVVESGYSGDAEV